MCGERTDYIMNADPDENWESNVARLQEFFRKSAEEPEDIPTLEGAKVVFDGERYFIPTHDVIRAGIHHTLQDMDLVRVGQQVFEVLEHHDEHRRYWVQPFSTELSEEDLARLAGP